MTPYPNCLACDKDTPCLDCLPKPPKPRKGRAGKVQYTGPVPEHSLERKDRLAGDAYVRELGDQ